MDQIRLTLDNYTERGGRYREVSIAGAGHVPFLSHPETFNPAFHAFLERHDP
jgi:pimeloyl-ACP methyl ester carboxylesterase